MKYTIFFIVLSLINTLAAQSGPNNLPLNKLLTREHIAQQSQNYTGGPFVYIEGVNEQHRSPSNWIEEMQQRRFTEDGKPIPVTFKSESTTQNTNDLYLAPMAIKSPFGQEKITSFINHTTDFMSIIQVLDEHNIFVEEQIQLINTTPDRLLERYLTKEITDNETTLATQIEPIEIWHNGHKIPLSFYETDNLIALTLSEKLAAGVQQFRIKYVIKNALTYTQKETRLMMDLIGTSWPFPIERLSAIVMLPGSTAITDKKMLFGTNNVDLPNGYSVVADETGNIAYHNTHILPAYSPVRILLNFDAKGLPAVSWTTRALDRLDISIPVLTFIIILMYMIASWSYAYKDKFKKNVLRQAGEMSPFILRSIDQSSIDLEFVNNLIKYKEKTNTKHRYLSMLKWGLERPKLALIFKGIAHLDIFFRVCAEIIFGAILLLILTAILTRFSQIHIPSLAWIILGVTSLIEIIIIYKTAFMQRLRRLTRTFIGLLSEADISATLSKAVIQKIYPAVLAVNKSKEWLALLKKNNPNASHLTFKE